MLSGSSCETDESWDWSDTPSDSVLAEVDSEEAKIDRSPKLKAHGQTLFKIAWSIHTYVARVNWAHLKSVV